MRRQQNTQGIGLTDKSRVTEMTNWERMATRTTVIIENLHIRLLRPGRISYDAPVALETPWNDKDSKTERTQVRSAVSLVAKHYPMCHERECLGASETGSCCLNFLIVAGVASRARLE